MRGVSGTLAVACALDTPGVVALGGEPAGLDAGIGVCVAPATLVGIDEEDDGTGVDEVIVEAVDEETVEADDEELPNASGRAERKASVRPSGDQRGELDD